MNLEHELLEARGLWATRPKVPIPSWFPPPPAWAQRDRVYGGAIGRQLWEIGEVHWGWVLLAEDAAWQLDHEVGMATVLFSDEPSYRREVGQYVHVGRRILTVRSWFPHPRPGMRVPWEWARVGGYPSATERVPFEFTEGAVVWRAGVMCHREVLPTGALRDRLVLLVRSTEPDLKGVHLLPHPYWPALLRAAWEAAASTPDTDANDEVT